MFSLSNHLAKGQNDDYSQIFSPGYQNASSWLLSNKATLDSVFKIYQVPHEIIKAIIFPELIRYNTVIDKIEIGSLETLYVQLGKDYANFSVGYFQMKPSFVERLDADAPSFIDRLTLQSLKLGLKPNDSKTERAKRLDKMETLIWQLKYLVIFYKIVYKKFSVNKIKTTEEKILFLATAYNCGYWKRLAEINKFKNQKYFYASRLAPGKKYNYASVSVFYFKNQK